MQCARARTSNSCTAQLEALQQPGDGCSLGSLAAKDAMPTLVSTMALSPEPYTTAFSGRGATYSAPAPACRPSFCRHTNLQAWTRLSWGLHLCASMEDRWNTQARAPKPACGERAGGNVQVSLGWQYTAGGCSQSMCPQPADWQSGCANMLVQVLITCGVAAAIRAAHHSGCAARARKQQR